MSEQSGPHVEAATVDDVDAVTDQWVALAADQRRHGSTLLATENRAAVREHVARSAVTGELLVARGGGYKRGTDDERPDGTDDPDAALLGFVDFSLDREGYRRDGTRGVVSNLFVRPDRRGEGIGSALLDAAERELAEAGADAVTLEALAGNDRARSFYTDHGYDPHRVEFRKPLERSASPESERPGDDPSAESDTHS